MKRSERASADWSFAVTADQPLLGILIDTTPLAVLLTNRTAIVQLATS